MKLPDRPSRLPKRLAKIAITLSLSLCCFLAFFVAAPNLAAEAYPYLQQHHVVPAAPVSRTMLHTAAAGNDEGVEHFSPSENLERPELDHLKAAAEHARAAKRPLDIAIYAFTDRILADLLVREAEQGTVIQIYRDGEQYQLSKITVMINQAPPDPLTEMSRTRVKTSLKHCATRRGILRGISIKHLPDRLKFAAEG